jgi:hypothetical protein
MRKQEKPMAVAIPADRPAIDPYPLSPYVAWAGNRNRDAILEAFTKLFPQTGDVLELASGSGMHINYFAPRLPQLQFQPSDYDLKVFDTIKAKRDEAKNANVADPVEIDLVRPETWPDPNNKRYDAIFLINIFQVAPLAITSGIAQIAAKSLKDDGLLAVYGPFKIEGKYTTESNESFDKEILAANVPEWGLKDVKDLAGITAQHGVVLKQTLELPANNFVLVFGKG